MLRRSRWFQVLVLLVVTAVVWCQPQTASAWFGRWHHGFYRSGFYGASFCRSGFYGGGFYGGGFGPGLRAWGGPGCGPQFYGNWGGGWGGGWGSCYGWPRTYYPCGYGIGYPYGYGGYGYSPIIVTPFVGSIAPTYGPAGVLPFMGFSSTNRLFVGVRALAARPAAVRPIAAPPAPQFAFRATAPAIAVRPSNGLAKLRAARLVAVGDRHLRAAVTDPTKLPAALDAYRRAAVIAADQAETFVRQAIVLAALDRDADAAQAIDRAVTIDARLGTDVGAALAAEQRLPPDPVFGERPDDGPKTLATRSTGLLAKIFRDDPAAAGVQMAAKAGPNWITARWSQQLGGQEPLAPVVAVAAK